MRPFVIGAAMLSLAAAAVRAQGVPSQWTKPGDTLKVWADGPLVRGAPAVVRRSTPDTIFFSVRSAASRTWLETPIAQDRITRIDVRDVAAKSAGRTALGAIGGLVAGGVVGGSLVYFTYQWSCPTRDNDCDGGDGEQIDRKVFTTFGAAIVGVAGAIAGGIMGARPVPGWRRAFTRP